MKQFLVFAGLDYYPEGGWSDFIGAYDTLDEAKANCPEIDPFTIDWNQIVDLNTHKIVYEKSRHD